MKIYYYSDLHFEENNDYLEKIIPEFITDKESILILAGDITHIGLIKKDKSLKKLCSNFADVYMICGNHEFHDGTDIKDYYPTRYTDYGFLKLVNNYSIKINNHNIIFSTLFTRINQMNEFFILRGVEDFNKIKNNSKSLLIKDYNNFNQTSIDFITNEIINNDNNIIITHHPPSRKLTNPFFINSVLNDSFYNNLDILIYKYQSKIKYWIYGHNHFNNDIIINDVNMITNQYGYGLHSIKNFNFNKFIEI